MKKALILSAFALISGVSANAQSAGSGTQVEAKKQKKIKQVIKIDKSKIKPVVKIKEAKINQIAQPITKEEAIKETETKQK